jgi:hypothetical protein
LHFLRSNSVHFDNLKRMDIVYSHDPVRQLVQERAGNSNSSASALMGRYGMLLDATHFDEAAIEDKISLLLPDIDNRLASNLLDEIYVDLFHGAPWLVNTWLEYLQLNWPDNRGAIGKEGGSVDADWDWYKGNRTSAQNHAAARFKEFVALDQRSDASLLKELLHALSPDQDKNKSRTGNATQPENYRIEVNEKAKDFNGLDAVSIKITGVQARLINNTLRASGFFYDYGHDSCFTTPWIHKNLKSIAMSIPNE